MRLVTTSCLLVLMACQSEQEGYSLLCESAERCNECRGQTVEIARMAHWTWLNANVQNGDVHETLGGLAQSAEEAPEVLREAARKAGVDPCPLADHLEDEEGLHRMWGSIDVEVHP